MSTAPTLAIEPEIEPYITELDFANRTTLSRANIRALRAKGEGPPFYKVGRRVVYLWTECRAWVDAQRVSPTRGGAS